MVITGTIASIQAMELPLRTIATRHPLQSLFLPTA